MSPVQKLLLGIVLLIIGISMLLGSSSILPWLGGLIGIVGIALVFLGLKSGPA